MSLPYGGFTTMLNPTQILAFAPWQDVRFGSKAGIRAAKSHVRFTPESRHWLVQVAWWRSGPTRPPCGRSFARQHDKFCRHRRFVGAAFNGEQSRLVGLEANLCHLPALQHE